MIIVKPNGGLGNRMRVINSAICLAKKNGIPPIKVLWKKDQGMNAAFTDIFRPIDEISVIENKYLMGYYFYSRKLIPAGYKYYNDQAILNNQFDERHWNKKHNNVILNTCYDFYQLNSQTNFFGLFIPVDKIQKRINAISVEFQGATVGVHIRRTDNVSSTNRSKTNDFIIRMDAIIQNDINTKFYVSTDDPKTEATLKSRYGDRVCTMTNKIMSRDSKQGIEDAVIDMYVLAQTNSILGSYCSSFSNVASAIGAIPLEIITGNR